MTAHLLVMNWYSSAHARGRGQRSRVLYTTSPEMKKKTADDDDDDAENINSLTPRGRLVTSLGDRKLRWRQINDVTFRHFYSRASANWPQVERKIDVQFCTELGPFFTKWIFISNQSYRVSSYYTDVVPFIDLSLRWSITFTQLSTINCRHT